MGKPAPVNEGARVREVRMIGEQGATNRPRGAIA